MKTIILLMFLLMGALQTYGLFRISGLRWSAWALRVLYGMAILFCVLMILGVGGAL
jgi:hypothetical protein